MLPSPPIRQRSEQLQQRLAKLQEQLDSQHYAAMVADVTQDEQAAAAAASDPFFPTTKLQLSFGLHVIVTMGTFFALGYYGGLFLLHSQSWVSSCAATKDVRHQIYCLLVCQQIPGTCCHDVCLACGC